MVTDILARLGTFSRADTDLFEQTVTHRTVTKGELLLCEGEVCRSTYYVLSGSLYQFSEGDGEQSIIDLHTAQEWCFNHGSFVEQKPSTTNLVVYSNGRVIELTIEQIHALISQSPAFLQMGRLLQQGVARLHYFDNALSPVEKYEHLLTQRPKVVQTFPLKLIASYLKITPETLSRVREKLARGSRIS